MKPKTMILMGLAITCGLGASYMTSRLLAERAPVEDEKIEILVAKRALSVGERLLKPEELFDKKQISKESEPPDAVRDFESLKGKSMKQSRNKGEHVTPANLRSEKEQLDIPEGQYAMGLKVNLEGTASGFATLPKSRVNIIQTVGRGGDASAAYSQLLLENVLVLAADLKLNADGELASPAQVVTFALTGEDVLKVNLAKELGILSLALRNFDHQSRTDEKKKVTGKDLNADANKDKEPVVVAEVKPEPVKPLVKEAPPVEVKEEPKTTKHEITIVHGTRTGQYKVEKIRYELTEDGQVVNETSQIIDASPTVANTQQRTNPRPTAPSRSGGGKEF